MARKAIFDTPEQAVSVLWGVMARLSKVVAWLAIALVHTAALATLLLVLWWTQTTPSQVAAAAAQALHAWPLAALAAAGVSVLSLAGAYLWLLRRALRYVHTGPLFAYLIRDATET